MAQIIIPTPLRKFTGNQAKIEVNAATVEDGIKKLISQFPDLENHLLDKERNIRSFIRIFVDQEDIRNLEQHSTPLKDGSTLSIIPAIAGGKE